MKFNVYVALVLAIISVHIVGVISQYRNFPHTRNSYGRPAALPRSNANARVQSSPHPAVTGYAPQAPRRAQRQSQAPTYVQTLGQVRPASVLQRRSQNVRPIRAQAGAVAYTAQRRQRPQQPARTHQPARPQQPARLPQPARPQHPARPQQPVLSQQLARPQHRQPQTVGPVAAASAATTGGLDFRGGFGATEYGRQEFEGPGFESPGFNGPGYGALDFGNHRGYGIWYHPHRPNPNLYRNFASVYKDIDSRADGNDYDATAEMDEINDDFNGRSIVAPGQYPHMAALGFRTASHDIEFKCGGSLISELFVLTAAHCCYFNGQVPDVVKVGDIKLKEFDFDNMPQRRRVAQVLLHPAYNSTMHYHDIAIILLNRPIVYTYFVRPIRLWVSDQIPYDRVYTMGYGSTSFAQAPTNVLTELDLSVVPWHQCNASLPPDENAPFGIVDTQICAKDFEKNRDTCQGDSGGPLQLNLLRRRRRRRFRYYLVGITSYGTFCRSPYPGVYTRVSSYIDWITSVVWPDYFNNFFG